MLLGMARLLALIGAVLLRPDVVCYFLFFTAQSQLELIDYKFLDAAKCVVA